MVSDLRPEDKRRLKDREWRLSHFYKIRDKEGKLIRFVKNAAQEDFEKKKHNRNIILKSRQLGFTTLEIITMLDDALFTKNYIGLLIAQDLQTAVDIFGNKVELAWNNFPLKDIYEVNRDSARQMKFDFGDKTFSSVVVDSSGRAGTFNRLHITEFAQVAKKYSDKAREILEGSIPAVPLTGRVDIESTAAGSEGRFYDMFWSAFDNGEPSTPAHWKAHFYNWQWDFEQLNRITPEAIKDFIKSKDYRLFEDYQKQHRLSEKEITHYYYQWLSLEKNWASLKQEYPTTAYEAFEASGTKLFDSIILSKFELREGEHKGDWIYYEQPKLGHYYTLGADVAEGVGQDSSACSIWDFTPTKPRVVAIYRNNRIAPDLFAYEIKDGAEKYGMSFVAVERNNHGHSTISNLKKIYPNHLIYVDEKEQFGWQTNLVNKPKMFYDFNTAVNNELIDVCSKELVSEMRRYDRENLDIRVFNDEATAHWDLLTAAVIGFQMKDIRPEVKPTGGSYTPGWVSKRWNKQNKK